MDESVNLFLHNSLGQRPKPSESLSESKSTVFKVHLSLFFSAWFFIDYLTLPKHIFLTHTKLLNMLN